VLVLSATEEGRSVAVLLYPLICSAPDVEIGGGQVLLDHFIGAGKNIVMRPSHRVRHFWLSGAISQSVCSGKLR
jgi:hypothetical protein